jgi:hypothetical protein
VTPTRFAQSFDNRLEKRSRTTGWFDDPHSGKIAIGRVSDEIEDQLDDPPPSEHLPMLHPFDGDLTAWPLCGRVVEIQVGLIQVKHGRSLTPGNDDSPRAPTPHRVDLPVHGGSPLPEGKIGP